MDSYFEVLAANQDTIVVVKVFAGFCRACKAFDRKYRALALEYEAAGANIKFYEMDWMETRDLCKSLQVGIIDTTTSTVILISVQYFLDLIDHIGSN